MRSDAPGDGEQTELAPGVLELPQLPSLRGPAEHSPSSGRGVSDTTWVGRGDCTGRTDMYTDYAKGGDILSYDIYPVNDGTGLEAVPKGVDNLPC